MPKNSPSAVPNLTEQSLRLLQIGIRHACSHGLSGADADESATEFLEWSLIHPEHARYSAALLEICAEHRTVDFIRRRARIRGRELPLPTDASIENSANWVLRCSESSPEQIACTAESCRDIEWAVALLTPSQQGLFRRHFVDEDSIGDIADSLGCSQHAIHQRLSGIRIQLRKHLAFHGISPAEGE